MFSSLPFVALALALFTPVAVNAHGYVQEVKVNGQESLSGFLPFTDPYLQPKPKRAVRSIPGDGPVLNPSSSDIQCNQGGQKGAPLVVPVSAGSSLTFNWTTWPADHLGYVSTYMTNCHGDCKSFAITGSEEWFKVDAAGYANGQWATMKLIQDQSTWTSTIPADLTAGEYLVRHEIIALHDSNQPQYYPMCLQVKVTGGGNLVPSGSQLVSVSKMYSSFHFVNIWNEGQSATSKIPGPKAIVGSAPNDNSDANDEEETTTTTTSTHSSSPTEVPTSSEEGTTIKPSSTLKPTAVANAAQGTPTGKCTRARSRRRSIVKRRVSHYAQRHH